MEDSRCPSCGRPTATSVALGEAGALAGNWWMFGLRGLLAVIFGILALAQPITALTALVLIFGVWAFIDGVEALALALSGWHSWKMLIVGLIGIGIGVVTFAEPRITGVVLFALIAAWAIARGILEIAVAIELRREVKGEVWFIVGGVASILFGVLMILLPVAGLLAIAWIIGVYALVYGVIMGALSLRLRRLSVNRQHPSMSLGAPTPQAT